MAPTPSYGFIRLGGCNMCGAFASEQRLYGRRLDGRQGLQPWKRGGISVSIYRCKVCGLVYPDPLPVPISLGTHYDVPPDEYWKSASECTGQGYQSIIADFQRITGADPTKCTALDIGAGIGRGMMALAQAGFAVSGVEPSPAFRQAAIERKHVAPENLLLGGVEEVDFEPMSFDLVVFSAVLEHLPNPARAVERALGWVKPAGAIYVEVPSSAWLMSGLMRLYYRAMGTDWVINTSPMHVPYHLFEFGIESFRRHGARAGYSVAEHRFFACETYGPPVLAPLLTGVMERSNTGMQVVVWLRPN